MARNDYPGECYRCGGWVPAGEGHFERHRRGWRVQHADCAIRQRGTPVDVLTEARTTRDAQKAFTPLPEQPK